jgi:predicted ATPase/DNA-binding CsgD family transcriptional regulator
MLDNPAHSLNRVTIKKDVAAHKLVKNYTKIKLEHLGVFRLGRGIKNGIIQFISIRLKAGSLVRAHKFPPQPTIFVGRSHELADLDRLLRDPACRLLTLVGPGGMGKTRLASEAAVKLLDQFPEGVYFVALQPLATPDLIIPSVLELLDCQLAPGPDPTEKLLNALREKSVLLVLDNFEHLMDATPLLSDILNEAPMVKLLVTSRERLNIRDEWVLEIGGLSVPNGDSSRAVEDYSAVQLFVQNARRVHPGFSLADQTEAVVRICQLLDGMPLALELASSWARALSSAEIVAEIERGLDILETSARDVPARHRNMRAVLDHSWERLDSVEHDVLKKMSVFRGGFTRDAARVVTGASLPVLAMLVDKSWLQHDSAGERYDIHELLRQYAGEKLEQSGLASQTLDAHLHYFADFMSVREGGIKYRRQTESLAEIECDFENVRSAWKRATVAGDLASINQMLEAMNFFCDMRARFDEGVELFTYAAKAFAGREDREGRLTYIRLRARRVRLILLGLGSPDGGLSDLIEELEAYLPITLAYQSPRDIAFNFYLLGLLKGMADFVADGVRAIKESLDIYTELDDRFYIAEMTVLTAFCIPGVLLSDEHLRRALAIQREICDLNGVGWTLIQLGRAAFWRHNYAEAERFFEESTAIQRERRDRKGLHSNLLLGSQRFLRLGEFEKALALAEESAEIAYDLNLPAFKQASMAVQGVLRILLETDVAGGKKLCNDALAMSIPKTFTAGDPYLDSTQGLFVAAYLSSDLEEMRQQYNRVGDLFPTMGIIQPSDQFGLLAPMAVFLAAREGRSERAVELMSFIVNLPDIPDAVTMRWLARLPLAVRLRDELRAQLGVEAYEAAWERGKTLDLGQTMYELTHNFNEADEPQIPAAESAHPDALTERELEVLSLVAEGLSNREIAARLVLALGTVKWYISEVYSKLGVTSRTQAVARARELQLLA